MPLRALAEARWMPERSDEDELLDRGCGTIEDVAASLVEMDRLNLLTGGVRALTRHLYPRLAGAGRRVTVVDLGAGSGTIPARIAGWAGKQGVSLQVIAVDWSARNLEIAQPLVGSLREVALVSADARRLPLQAGTADYAISSLFLHHFPPDELICLLRRTWQVVRCGLVMTDMVRSRLLHAGFQVVQPLLARNFLTAHDGDVSIRSAYTPAELRRLVEAAGLPRARIYTHWLWRMTLVVDKE